MTGNIQFGKASFAYEVSHVVRKTLEIAVHPDRRVVVTAPLDAGRDEIESKLRKRARWVLRQIDFFRQFEPRTPTRRFVSGETHRYLGRQYQLKVARGETTQVKMSRGRIVVDVAGAVSPAKVADCLEGWYRAKAREYFRERLECCAEGLALKDSALPRLQIRRMRSRWGSLSPNATLTLNLALIQTPRECIDYVITHELCHLKFDDHGSGFYKLLGKLMPDWEKRKRKLELALT